MSILLRDGLYFAVDWNYHCNKIIGFHCDVKTCEYGTLRIEYKPGLLWFWFRLFHVYKITYRRQYDMERDYRHAKYMTISQIKTYFGESIKSYEQLWKYTNAVPFSEQQTIQ